MYWQGFGSGLPRLASGRGHSCAIFDDIALSDPCFSIIQHYIYGSFNSSIFDAMIGGSIELAMSLVRRKQEFASTVNGVEFIMHDGLREVACRAAVELLRNPFGSRNRMGDGQAFTCNRDALEGVASDKCRAGKTEIGFDPEIIITDRTWRPRSA
jgi:hypothetical protein